MIEPPIKRVRRDVITAPFRPLRSQMLPAGDHYCVPGGTVADRILRYAAIAGRENVVAGTDCGLGGRVHADLMQGVVVSEN